MDTDQAIIDMMDKINASENNAAQDVFNNLMAVKLQAALDSKKQEIAQSLYSQETSNNIEDENQDLDTEEEVEEDGSNTEEA